MANLNKYIAIGRLTRDPESRASGKIVSFGFCVNNRRKAQDGSWGDEPCYLDVDCFGKTAEFVQQYLRTGDLVLLDGSLRMDQWVTPEGAKRSKLKVNAFAVQGFGGKETAKAVQDEWHGRPEEKQEERQEELPF